MAGLVFVLFGFFSPLTGVSPAYAGEDGLTWVVTQASGDVRHRAGEFFSTEWQKLRVGDVVGAAAEIRTGRNSRVVLRHRKTTITAASESRLALPGRSVFSGAYRILQNLGTLLYNIKERADGMAAFEVETPYLVALVKGTVFTVNASAEEASVQLSEGIVRVRPTGGGKGTTLAEGQTARVTRASSTDVIIGGRGDDRRSNVAPPALGRPAKANDQRTGLSAGGRTATTASGKGPGKARTSTGTKNPPARVRASAGRQVAALSEAKRGDSGGGSADDARDGGRVAGERADDGDPGGDGPRGGDKAASSAKTGNPGGGAGDGGQAPGASPEGGNPGGGGAGGGTDVGGSVDGGDPGGGQLARSDHSQDTARGANTGGGTMGNGEAELVKMATGSSATIWSVPTIGMETAKGWMATIWEGITEGMDTWVGAVWLLGIWAVVWVAVSTLRISFTRTRERPSKSDATMAKRGVRQPA